MGKGIISTKQELKIKDINMDYKMNIACCFIIGLILFCVSEFFCGMFPQHEKEIIWGFGVAAGVLVGFLQNCKK